MRGNGEPHARVCVLAHPRHRAHAARSPRAAGLTSNRLFLYAVGGSLLGQLAVVYLPPLQAVFQTEAISLVDWAYIIATTSTVLWVDEARKLLARRGMGGPWAAAWWRGKRRLRYGYTRVDHKRTDAGWSSPVAAAATPAAGSGGMSREFVVYDFV